MYDNSKQTQPRENFKSAHLVVNFIVIFSSLMFLFVSSGVPILALVGASHDDGLFFRSLESILSGNWLGEYDNLTLAKGPMLSIVGSISAALGVHAKMIEAVIYLGAAGALFILTRRIGLPATAAVAIFILILSNPHIWSYTGRRYLREVMYSTWAIFAIVSAIGMLSVRKEFYRKLSAASVGFFAGCAYLTREEDIWIISILASLFIVAALISLSRHGVGRIFSDLRIKIKLALIGAATMAAIVLPVLIANKVVYGRAVVSEFRSTELRAAIGALMRVGDIHPSGYVPVSQSAMSSVFEVAPVTENLQKFWPTVSKGWAKAGGNLVPEYPNEIGGGWFIWAFRDAVAAAGYYSSATAARDFYVQLSKEVNEACDSGQLVCRKKRVSLAPELTAERFPDLFASFWRSVIYTAKMGSNKVRAAPSDGDTLILQRWNSLIGPVLDEEPIENASADALLLSGWLASTIGPVSLTPEANSSTLIHRMDTSSATDVVRHFEKNGTMGIDAVRFSVVIDCPLNSCQITVVSKSGVAQTVSLDTPASGAIPLKPPFYGHLDIAEKNSDPALSGRIHQRISLAIASFAVSVAQVTIPLLSITATIGFLLFIVYFKRHQHSDPLFIITSTAAVAVLMRCLIISYIDITSWRAVNVGYLGPSYPFMIIYAVTGTVLCANIIKALRSEGRKGRKLPSLH